MEPGSGPNPAAAVVVAAAEGVEAAEDCAAAAAAAAALLGADMFADEPGWAAEGMLDQPGRGVRPGGADVGVICRRLARAECCHCR